MSNGANIQDWAASRKATKVKLVGQRGIMIIGIGLLWQFLLLAYLILVLWQSGLNGDGALVFFFVVRH